MPEDRDIPCPGCGYKVLSGHYGSYDICPFCNWEDCAFQLANPLDVGGPNGRSLVDHQATALKQWPLDVRHAELYGRHWLRDESWRPLTAEEIAAHESDNDWHPAVASPEQCYWNRSPGATGSAANQCDVANHKAHGFEAEPVAPGALPRPPT